MIIDKINCFFIPNCMNKKTKNKIIKIGFGIIFLINALVILYYKRIIARDHIIDFSKNYLSVGAILLSISIIFFVLAFKKK